MKHGTLPVKISAMMANNTTTYKIVGNPLSIQVQGGTLELVLNHNVFPSLAPYPNHFLTTNLLSFFPSISASGLNASLLI